MPGLAVRTLYGEMAMIVTTGQRAIPARLTELGYVFRRPDIEDALAKFDAGTYGECEVCGQRIPEARLEAMPAARVCITCASPRR